VRRGDEGTTVASDGGHVVVRVGGAGCERTTRMEEREDNEEDKAVEDNRAEGNDCMERRT
jgi:hypothetical protein